MHNSKKITQQERELLDLYSNLSDAQVYDTLTDKQIEAIADVDFLRLPRDQLSMDSEKAAFLRAFSEFHAGLQVPGNASEVLFGYSASTAIEIVANALRVAEYKCVGLLHPTYDATYHILVRHGCKVVPVPEEVFLSDPVVALTRIKEISALVLTLPNNPTGRNIRIDDFRKLCCICVERNIFLVIDCCFRCYDELIIQHYEDFMSYGVHGCIIEDTGKLFSVKDLKLGTIWTRGCISPLIRDVHRDFILEVPLFNLRAMRRLLEVSGPDYVRLLRQSVARNRAAAVAALIPVGFVALGDGASNVQLFRTPGEMNVHRFRDLAFASGVGVVEGGGYFWAGHPGNFIRVALARPSNIFEKSVLRLAQIAVEFS